MLDLERICKLVRVVAALLIVTVLSFMGADLAFPLPKDRLYPPSSQQILDKDGRILRAFLAPDQMWRLRVTSEQTSSQLKLAVLAYEDRHFYVHPGINPAALLRAASANIRAGRIIQGGSTITMQVARLIEPKERTVASKLIEMFRALQLELHLTKDEILTCYFNLAPYGGNIVGIGAAARSYFQKAPDALSLGEAALLAAIPNSPNRYRPDVNPEAAAQARAKILRIMRDRGAITEQQREEAQQETIPRRRFDLPFSAPHFAELIREAYPDQEIAGTTLDSRVQELAEHALDRQLAQLSPLGIHSGAVVVVDNRSGTLLALVGSQEYFDSLHSGQVNGATAPRSPGSALKPFVYALALDRGVISSRTLIYDVPVEFAGYKPVNYDETFNGAVAAEDALIRSLNVPAINLAAQTGGEKIFEELKRCGLTTLNRPWSQYGLPLVLGGCEVKLLELTNLYAALANSGRYRRLRFLKSDSATGEHELVDTAAAFIVSEILSRVRRPELPSAWEAATNVPKVAWKTGTSLGKRDAWSIGYNRDYTIGVWIGNFNGRGHPQLIGAEAAAPVLFDLFETLATGASAGWFEQPPNVACRQVCALSGMLATEFCTVVEDEPAIVGVAPNQPCSMHEAIIVDQITGQRLCKHCRAGHATRERIAVRWPTAIATWMQRNGRVIDAIPAHNPQCGVLASGDGPVIVSPIDESDFQLRPEVARRYQRIRLDASVANETRTIYWFLNQKLIYSGAPTQQVFFDPTPGKHVIVCMDDRGRSSEVEVSVR